MYRDSFLGEFKENNYTITKSYLDSQIKNIRLYHTKFTPKQPKASIAIIHGFGEHSGRFYEIGKFFAQNEYESLLIDLTGFGYSGGARGCSTVEMMMNDVITLLAQARPDLPLFMYSHSMGCLLTVKLLITHPELRISGCIMTGPFLNLPADRHFPKSKLFFIKLMGDDLQDLIINAMVNPTALTKNNKYLHNIFEDRLMLPFLSAKMAKSLFDGVEFVQKNLTKFSYPVMIFHGKQDSLCDYRESKKFVQSKISPYKRLHVFQRGYHELQHDEEKDEMLEMALKFLEKLPESMKRSVGKIVYANYSFKLKPKTHPIRNGTRIILVLGILFFLYRRFMKK